MVGIVAGIGMSGLLLSAFSGSVVILLVAIAISLAIAGLCELVKSQHSKAASHKLQQYPPYGY